MSINEFNWKESNSHLLLLCKFKSPLSPADFVNSDIWVSVLGENAKQAIDRFSQEGLLVASDLKNTLSYKFKVSELKEMLKKRGMSVSGKKEELILRLIDADPGGMKKVIVGLNVFECTKKGIELADEYLISEKEKLVNVELQILEHIKNRDFKKASLTLASYESEQVFPRGMGVGWKNHNPDREIRLLTDIFGFKPKILSKLEDDKLENLRVGAAMMALWGKNDAKKWLPPNFETGLSIDGNTASRMFFFYALHKASIKQYRESGVVKFVEILSAQDSCVACKKLSKIKFTFDELPEFPYEKCTHEMGCRCVTIPIVD